MTGIDVNHDGTIDLTLPGASPLHKDLFVEVDAMLGRAPLQETLDKVVKAFAEAPSIYNPDARGGVHLVALLDETTIPLAPWTALDGNNWPIGFKTIKQNQSPDVVGGFGTQKERMNANWANIREAKRQSYRYCIFGDSYGGTASSGLAELGGNDFMVTLGSVPTATQEVGFRRGMTGYSARLTISQERPTSKPARSCTNSDIPSACNTAATR